MTAIQVSKSQCIQVQSNPGYYLLRDAAYAWDRATAAFGKLVLITGAWRSYETQERIFLERYDRGYLVGNRGYTDDARWWPLKGSWYTRKAGFAAAAVPGTSNHGGGLAVDVKTRREDGDPTYATAVIFGSWDDADRTRFLRVAAEHGWDDDEGRSVGELWHLTYYPARDKHRGVKPTTILQEDPDMDATQAAQLSTTNANVKKLLDLLGDRVADVGTEAGLTHGTAHERELILLRRIEGQQIAAAAAPDAVVDIDADAVADALVERLPGPVAKALAANLTARLAN